MFSRMIKLVEPRRFEEYITLIGSEEESVLVKPIFLSICKADMRYFLGQREKNILALKYPFCLIHEAVGEVVKSKSGFTKGDLVALVPNMMPKCEECLEEKDCIICKEASLGMNYCSKAKFASSNEDGFLREYIEYEASNLVKLPTLEDKQILVFCELISVAFAAIRRINLEKFDNIIVWGSGTLAYILAAVIKHHFKLEVTVVGRRLERLEEFKFCKVKKNNEPMEKKGKTIIFECVGGENSQTAINEILKVAPVGSEIVLMGVPDNNPELNVRNIMEKGLVMSGSTRSQKGDFISAVKCFEDKEFCEAMKKLALSVEEVKTIYELQKCFEQEEIETQLGKNIIKLNL